MMLFKITSEELAGRSCVNRRNYYCYKLVKKIYPDVVLLPHQVESLWEPLYRFVDCDWRSTDYYVTTTDAVIDCIKKWMEAQNRERIYHIQDLEWQLPREDVVESVKTTFRDFISIILSPLVYMIVDYLFHPVCIFCRGLRRSKNTALTMEQIILVQQLCHQTKKCNECGVSIMHHWYRHYNYSAPDEYLSVSLPLNNRSKNLICPFGICKCCNGKVPSVYWDSLCMDVDDYGITPNLWEFTEKIEETKCRFCPRCNVNVRLNSDYKCQHRPSITYFK